MSEWISNTFSDVFTFSYIPDLFSFIKVRFDIRVAKSKTLFENLSSVLLY